MAQPTETSAAFNLADLMRIENERIATEADAVRKEADKREQARVEAVRRAEQAEQQARALEANAARDRRENEQERQLEVERERRVQENDALVAARVEVELARLALAHDREVRRLERGNARAAAARVLAPLLTVVVALGFGAYVFIFEPNLRAARAGEASAQAIALRKADEVGKLQEQIAGLSAARQSELRTNGERASVPQPVEADIKRAHRQITPKVDRDSTSLDWAENSRDPLDGVLAEPTRKGGRRLRDDVRRQAR